MKHKNLILVLLLLLWFCACEREQRRFTEIAPASGRPRPAHISELRPGSPEAPAADPTSISMPTKNAEGPYDGNGWAISEGKRLYTWFNCVGCHANGGGGMGPPLMDEKWIYGSDSESIHSSIVSGRPNGMPAFGGKLADQQVWQLVAYVRALGGIVRKDLRPGRNDDMAVRPSEQAMESQTPRAAETAPAEKGPQK
jgi:cytochrome c oxidase cbb3-type subunit 3